VSCLRRCRRGASDVAVTDEMLGLRLWQDAKAQALGTAKLAGAGQNQKELTPEEEDRLFMEEAKGWTIEKEMELLASGKSPRVVGDMKYPHRMKMAARGDRTFDKLKQYQWLAEKARRVDPTWTPLPTPPKEPPLGQIAAPEPPAAPVMGEAPDLSVIGG
jgi:hypothetical protein